MRGCSMTQNAVAIVHAIGNEGVNEHPGVVSRERLAYGPQLTKLVKHRAATLFTCVTNDSSASIVTPRHVTLCDVVMHAVLAWNLDQCDVAELLPRTDPDDSCQS